MKIIANYILVTILSLSFFLNLCGINWGLSGGEYRESWHPDEIIDRANSMAKDRSLNHHHFVYGPLHYYQVIFFVVAPLKVLKKAFNLLTKIMKNDLYGFFKSFIWLTWHRHSIYRLFVGKKSFW
jgi:hypothetical protein